MNATEKEEIGQEADREEKEQETMDQGTGISRVLVHCQVG